MIRHVSYLELCYNGELRSIQHYAIMFVSDLPQVGAFLRLLRFLHQLNWPPRYFWNIVESGVKHHKLNLKYWQRGRIISMVFIIKVMTMMFHFKTAIVAIMTKDKQWSTKSYTEKLKIQQHNPTKNRFCSTCVAQENGNLRY